MDDNFIPNIEDILLARGLGKREAKRLMKKIEAEAKARSDNDDIIQARIDSIITGLRDIEIVTSEEVDAMLNKYLPSVKE